MPRLEDEEDPLLSDTAAWATEPARAGRSRSSRLLLLLRQPWTWLLPAAIVALVLYLYLHPRAARTGAGWDSEVLELKDRCVRLAANPPEDLYTARLDKLAKVLGDDAVYVAEPGPGAEYFSGQFGPGAWGLSERPLLIAINGKSEVTVLAPGFETPRAQGKKFGPGVEPKWLSWREDQSPYAVLSPLLKGKKLVLDKDVRTFVGHGLVSQAAKASSEEQDDLSAAVQALRERKGEYEIELMRCANQLTLAAIKHTRKHMRVGMRESEARAIYIQAMAQLGFDHFDALILFGPNAATPHGRGDDRKLGHDEFALIDAGGEWGGYPSDITRTFYLAEQDIPRAHCEAWGIVRAAQRSPADSLKNGTTFARLDEVARDVVTRAMEHYVPKYEGKGPDYTIFTHRLGHGIGLEGHEAPYAVQGPLGERPVLSGHSHTLEPGIYIPAGMEGVHEDFLGLGIRIEDVVVARETEDGGLKYDWMTGPVGEECGSV